MLRNRITEARHELERVVRRMTECIGDCSIAEEQMMKYDTIIHVAYNIDDDLFKRVDVEEVLVLRGNDHDCPMIELWIFEKLRKGCEEYNRENECEYLERLNYEARKEYYACLA